MSRRGWVVASAGLALALGGCKLTEVSLVDAEDVVLAEVYVEMVPDLAGRDRVTALLHRTLSTGDPVSSPVPGAHITVTRSDGFSMELAETSLDTCVSSTPVDGTGTCYWASPDIASRLAPGDSLELSIRLADGGELFSTSVVPGDFALLSLPSEGACSLAPDTTLDMAWTGSAGAWAYVDETRIYGLRAALEPRGITDVDDPLYLLGLSVSAADTTVTFPSQFGVFDRFDLDQGVALQLQKGLPDGTDARITITAGDRNYVNWVRGGNFNPSGTVRVPSIRGDGSGVFGATVSHSIHVYASATGMSGVAPCSKP